MKNSLILCCCFLFCCCSSLRIKSKLGLVQDSVEITESMHKQQMISAMEMQQTLQEEWEGEQFMEIFSAGPYRLHPDSGLLAGAGYLKLRFKGKERVGKRQINTHLNNLSNEHQQYSKEKLQVRQVFKKKQSEKTGMPYVWYVLLIAGLAVGYFIYRNLKSYSFLGF